MSDAQNSSELDFEQAQFDEPARGEVLCESCKRSPGASYFSVNGQSTCPRCLAQLREGQEGSIFKALGLGLAAGAVGALAYYGIRELTGYDLALITIVLGVMVGLAVRKGAGASRHVVYRLMAIALAWAAMCVTYAPEMVAGMSPSQQTDAAGESASETELAPGDLDADAPAGAAVWVTAAILSLAVPFFLLGEMQVLGLLIFGFGLWEAYRLSAPRPFVVEGPFELAGR